MSAYIGQRIREMRGELGWSELKLARAANLSQPHINQIENGKKTPSLPALSAIAGALGVEVADLLRAPAEQVQPKDR